MFCPICKQEIKDNSKYCGMCGRKIPRCPTCGMVIQSRMSFCIQDGTPLPEDIISAFPMEVKTEQHFESTGNITEVSGQLNCENVRGQIASQTEDLYFGEKKRGSCLVPALLGVILAFIVGVMILTGALILSGEISSVRDLFNLIHVHELKEETLEEEIVNNEDSDATESLPAELVEKLNAESVVEKSERATSSDHMDISEDDEELVSFADGSSVPFELEDSMNAQTFYFDTPVETESVIFTICSVYPGTKYEDTVISEVELL